ncbi:MAG: AAA family ATPase [Desulfovibrio sp.]|nr:AAA family ATPase [Desulfovibrio sp.]
MQELPLGVHNFSMVRRDNLLYVDKTAHLCDLIANGRRYFLARPRRFGKSMTLSTLEALFAGKEAYFTGLAAFATAHHIAATPYPVLRFDMSSLGCASRQILTESLKSMLVRKAKAWEIPLTTSLPNEMLCETIEAIYKKYGSIVLLIDEYDKPILDAIPDEEKALCMRKILRDFYTTIKSCDEYFRFIFITGISKFSKIGLFSAMNNLLDISLTEQYSDIVGYTQEEIESYFDERIQYIARKKNISKDTIIDTLRTYYDGFSFDGKTKLYNPFSILSYFTTGELKNYWYESASPSFIVHWLEAHGINEPDEYRHIQVESNFTSSQEIEQDNIPSFLFQSGYLTIEKKEDNLLTLDYPNREVLDSISSLYLKLIYKIEQFASLGHALWRAVDDADFTKIAEIYNSALCSIPYDDFAKNRNEFWYRSLFIMLLRGAGILTYNEPHTSLGRADVILDGKKHILLLEFKFAKHSANVLQKKEEGIAQIKDRKYVTAYSTGKKIVSHVFVADDEKRLLIS